MTANRVNGFKKWITGALTSDYVTTVVRTGDADSGASGISVLVIPLDLEGVERTPLKNSGVNASGSTLIGFHDVKVPARFLLGKENEGELLNDESATTSLAYDKVIFLRLSHRHVQFQRRTTGAGNICTAYVKNMSR